MTKTKHTLIKEIDQLVEEANHDADWRRAYMMYEMELLDARKEGKLEDAKAMLMDDLPIEKIVQYTGLTLFRIEELRDSILVSSHPSRKGKGRKSTAKLQ